ncbi:MAG: hypothetical protein PHV37_01035 [Candidatus Gastranaerophilales bacterium]|nr:hypothetical protein [Candidatus Gastranaerophilales bacterium]
MENNSKNKINFISTIPQDYEEFMGWEPDIYDFYLNEENETCRYKETIINFTKHEINYLKIVIKNSKKNKYTKSSDIAEVVGIAAKSVDKIKERINKKFRQFADFDLIVNKSGYGNKINNDIGLFS